MTKFARQAERAAQIYAAVAIAAFSSSALVYLYLGRWTVTMADFWPIYEIYLNHLWLESALVKINQHPTFFPSLILLADLRFLHGDQQLHFFVGMLLLFCTTILLLVPLWRDKTVGFTAKLAGTLVVIVGNFWMGNATIITSGGNLCTNSLAKESFRDSHARGGLTNLLVERFTRASSQVVGFLVTSGTMMDVYIMLSAAQMTGYSRMKRLSWTREWPVPSTS